MGVLISSHTNCEVIYMEKAGKIKANPLISGADGKVYHIPSQAERKLPAVFPAIDNDLAVENITNDFDMTAADLQDL